MAGCKRANGEKVRVIACGMLAREVLAVCEANGLDHVSLRCLPAEYHHRPERIAPALEKAILAAREAGFSHIIAGYGDCGSAGAVDRVCRRHGVERIAGPHCFAFYQGAGAADAHPEEDMRAFYLTDFLARHFETFLIRPLGLDRHPELRDMYFVHYEKLVYLAQTEDPWLEEKARAAAERLSLSYERRFTGYGGLASALLASRPEGSAAGRALPPSH